MSVKVIGALDAMVGFGLVLPGQRISLVPWEALGGTATAGDGSVVHLHRAETQLAAVNVVYIALLALVAWGRFGAYAF
ncbi:hypothetical protein OIE43_42955 [Streptomyces pseudovenezuelae]|uniref:hypothetical protein n=1 Tax=Streptomyces pseudovenezuelae TaxID=67350 RepID=UPI002E308B4B|nr:hypothetical protein [Streptomyces pseudovenezuelae]